MRLIVWLFLLLLSVSSASAQSIGTMNIQGPSTGGPLITPSLLNSAVNAQQSNKVDANGGVLTSPTINNGTVSGTILGAGSVTATGGTTARTLADTVASFTQATDYGAVFDATNQVSGSITAGSSTFTRSGSFVSADIGKSIIIRNAGPNGDTLATTISAISGATATLSAAASAPVPSSVLAQGTVVLAAAGTGYAPGDTIVLAGGTATYQATLQVMSTQVATASVVGGGSGGTTGACTFTGTTGNTNGTTTLFQGTGTVTAGALGGSLVVTVAGEYKDNPNSVSVEPITGCGLVGATVSLGMGVKGFLTQHQGAYSVRPSDPISQGSTSGSGSGATFTGSWNNSGSWTYGTDNAAAIQAAINHCDSAVVTFSGGCTVLLPTGTGLVTAPLVINKQEVSLSSISRSAGFFQRNIAGEGSQSYPTRLQYAGPDNPGHMLTLAPLLADGKRLVGNDVSGIMFDCGSRPGCSGLFIQEVIRSTFKVAVSEPYPRLYTTVGTTTAGSNTVVVTSSTGISLGQVFMSPNVLSGTYVAAISGNTLTISSQAFGSGIASGAPIYIGGEGFRLDVLTGMALSGTQLNDFYISSRNLNTFSPCLTVGGSSTSAPFGNTSANRFYNVDCTLNFGDAVEANNSDHNWWFSITTIPVPNSFAIGAAFVSNGSLDANNAASRYNWIFQNVGPRAAIFRGTSFGGWTLPSNYNKIQWSLFSTTPVIEVDTDGTASLCVSGDIAQTIGCLGPQALEAQLADSTSVGGNTRGANAVDFQSVRNVATQVASGARSTIAGGESNVASGTDSFAVGSASAASGIGTVATGISALSDLYGVNCHSSGNVAAAKHAETCSEVLRIVSAANTTPVRLTADGLSAGSANCVNFSASGSAYNMLVKLVATDSTTGSNNFAWTQPIGLLARSGGVGTVTYSGGTPVTLANGTTSGLAITEAADTTNGCYSLTFTPPTSNTHIWHVVATVTWTRTD